ncbi:hypothetical protein CVT26_007544 [Gymnopilus dilepis]|uniref:Uncharacterized protein n=1 Tax=Gymnopilus dilepis TaxID=231916 RepID=A0A409X2M4_9AGAR|nr:hypothetical protein CVT26_007544 [Gymnopilus dilepis]
MTKKRKNTHPAESSVSTADQRTMLHLQDIPAQAFSESWSPQPHSPPHKPEASSWRKGKNFYVYAFLDAFYPSYRVPELGTPGPVEQFAGISYPGEDPTIYRLDEGYTVPQALVDEYDMHNVALSELGKSTQESFSHCLSFPGTSSHSPDSPRTSSKNGSRGGKARAVSSGNEEDVRQGVSNEDLPSCGSELGASRRASTAGSHYQGTLYSTEATSLSMREAESADLSIVDDLGERQTVESLNERTDDEGQDASNTLPIGVAEACRKGGRPSNAFYRDAAAIAKAYYDGVARVMKIYKVSQKVAEIATGLQPRVVETRKTSTWNIHQRVYKIQNPKQEEESVAGFKARQGHDYALHVKPLAKEEKMKVKEDYESMVMDFFLDGKGKDLKILSPAKRVESACKALQKLAQMISRADHEIQCFGGVNYVGSDKAGEATRGATFVSGDVVLRAIKLFNIGTQAIMLKTTAFLKAAVSKQEMDQALEVVSSALLVTTTEADRNDKHATHPTVSEAAHITIFNNSDPRKRGRSYLGFTYKKVNSRATVDWLNLLHNMVKSQFRLRNCDLSPHPGQKEFAVEKIPLKKWQEIGNLLTADDFHPVTGGQNPKALAFIPWTEEEKRYRIGSREYCRIPLIVGQNGEPLICLSQAEQLSKRAS